MQRRSSTGSFRASSIRVDNRSSTDRLRRSSSLANEVLTDFRKTCKLCSGTCLSDRASFLLFRCNILGCSAVIEIFTLWRKKSPEIYLLYFRLHKIPLELLKLELLFWLVKEIPPIPIRANKRWNGSHGGGRVLARHVFCVLAVFDWAGRLSRARGTAGLQ